MLRFLLPVIFAVAATAQSRKTVFIITDAEGVAGICRQDQTDPKDAELRALLTVEINAAVEGFYAGGADEVIVWDGHDGSQTLARIRRVERHVRSASLEDTQHAYQQLQGTLQMAGSFFLQQSRRLFQFHPHAHSVALSDAGL